MTCMQTQMMTVMDSIIAGFTKFTQFVPNLVGALLILIVGWFIAKLGGGVLERILRALRFEHAVSHSGFSGYLQTAFGSEFTTTHVLGVLMKWFVFLIFVQAAANLLYMPVVTSIINNIILFLPNLFIALVIMVVGAWGARTVGRLVEVSVARTGVSSPGLFSLIARYTILGFAAIAAVNQLGIATNLLGILFGAFVGSVALAVGLAFGLGGQGVAQDLTRSWYEQGRTTGARLKAVDTQKRG